MTRHCAQGKLIYRITYKECLTTKWTRQGNLIYKDNIKVRFDYKVWTRQGKFIYEDKNKSNAWLENVHKTSKVYLWTLH